VSRGINKTILVGNVGTDLTVRHGHDERPIVSFRIATTESWKSDGERKERTEWHNVVIFGGLADVAIRLNVKTGTRLYIEGKGRTRKWQGNEGDDRYTHEVVVDNHYGELLLMDSKPVGGNH
jgi:single-strand DNA-binding protein